jgi:hypothetical protein
MNEFKSGQRTNLPYEGREFDVVVIDPHGLGQGQPSLGFGFKMMEKNAGVPQSTLSTWVYRENGKNFLKLPSGKLFRYIEIIGVDNKPYSVVEASDWFAFAIDILVNPGKVGKPVRTKLGDFITWFAVKGFYAEAYVALKGVYTQKDSRATTQWLESRQIGKIARKLYTDLLQSQGCQDYQYADWTNYVYVGLFGMPKSKMVEVWELVDGDPAIGRNYIPKPEGLDAVRYCEDMVVRMFVKDLEEAHEMAVNLTKRKFLGGN